MIKVSSFISQYLNVRYGVEVVFMVTGGGAMHLNDSFGRNRSIRCVFNHHEQACAIGAEGFARATGKIGVVNVTTGPGGLNTFTGVMGQWTDSVPVLYLSGQVKMETTVRACPDIPLRQLGDQEIDITRIVAPLTKYATMVTDPKQIRYELDRAVYEATSGRPGPVWLDIPMDVQGAMIEEEDLLGYNAPSRGVVSFDVDELVNLITGAERPVIIAGHGIRISGARERLQELISRLRIPVVATFNGYDILSSDNDFLIGRFGTLGDRAGNFAVQNADLVLAIGTRNNIRQVSYGYTTFARSATKVVVDIDTAELKKPTVKPDIAIGLDAGEFIDILLSRFRTDNDQVQTWSKWLEWCTVRRSKYPVVLPEYRSSAKLNPYHFMEQLTDVLSPNHIVVAGNGTACVTLFQAGTVKDGQRIFWNSGCASMGYDLPAAIGAAVGMPGRPVVCLAGDGSLQMNIQELATLARSRFDIKLFVLNNNGYSSIRQTQMGFFGPPMIGCDPESGLGFPNYELLAAAYSLPYARLEKSNLDSGLRSVISSAGPVMCEVILEWDYRFAPKLSSERRPDGRIISKPLEDLSPLLDRDEFRQNMIVAPMEEE